MDRDFKTFIRTNNTCGPEPPLIDRLEKTAEAAERMIIREVEEIEEEVEKVKDTEVNLFRRLAEGFKVFLEDEKNVLNGPSKEEEKILNGLQMEAAEVEKLFENASYQEVEISFTLRKQGHHFKNSSRTSKSVEPALSPDRKTDLH